MRILIETIMKRYRSSGVEYITVYDKVEGSSPSGTALRERQNGSLLKLESG